MFWTKPVNQALNWWICLHILPQIHLHILESVNLWRLLCFELSRWIKPWIHESFAHSNNAYRIKVNAINSWIRAYNSSISSWYCCWYLSIKSWYILAYKRLISVLIFEEFLMIPFHSSYCQFIIFLDTPSWQWLWWIHLTIHEFVTHILIKYHLIILFNNSYEKALNDSMVVYHHEFIFILFFFPTSFSFD